MTRNKIMELKWEIMSHPPYSPTYLSLWVDKCEGKKFNNESDLKKKIFSQ